MSLLNKFLELRLPISDNPKLFNASDLQKYPFAKIGVNNEGFPVLLISPIATSSFVNLKNVRLKYLELTHDLECKISENNAAQFSNFSVLIFRSNELSLQSYFLKVAETLLQSFSETPTEQKILEALRNFIEIFSSLTNFPTRTLQGLWSELFLMDISKSPETLLDYWHNIPEEKFDFNADSEKIEVKSSSRFERIHIFSAGQLNVPECQQVIIASLFTKQSSSGLSVIDLIESIRKRVFNTILLEKLYFIVSSTLGNTIDQAVRIKFDYALASNSLKFYRHQDICKIERIDIPQEVTEVKFKSDLSNSSYVDLASVQSDGILFKSIYLAE